MTIAELIEKYPDKFALYTEKILDNYFGNIFVTYKNEKILFANAKLADSVHMTKEELTSLSLEELRKKKLWARSLSKELYDSKKGFDAYNVSKWGNELFTHVEPILDENGQVIMSVQYSIPKEMLEKFSHYIAREKDRFENYKDILDYLNAQKEASENIICVSPSTKVAFDDALHLSKMDSTVLIYGETGTGKDVLCNYIHRNSKRASEPFIPVNCSAIPAELVESEFFGYEKGAFTGARNDGKSGLFEMANRGTLFLDEIGELPLAVQAKLLRVLETGEVMRIGGSKLIKTNVRVIAATNRDLKKMVQEKTFREDLYYRLNVMPIYLSPLRERSEDIIPLAELFLSRYNHKYNFSRMLTEEITADLLSYHWPGNIRELKNIIERFVISGRIDIFTTKAKETFNETPVWTTNATIDAPLHAACEAFEKEYIKNALDTSGGSVIKASQALGIHRSLLYKKMHKYRLI